MATTTQITVDNKKLSLMRQNALALRKMADNVLADIGQLEEAARVPERQKRKADITAEVKASLLSRHKKPTLISGHKIPNRKK